MPTRVGENLLSFDVGIIDIISHGDVVRPELPGKEEVLPSEEAYAERLPAMVGAPNREQQLIDSMRPEKINIEIFIPVLFSDLFQSIIKKLSSRNYKHPFIKKARNLLNSDIRENRELLSMCRAALKKA